MNEAVGVVLSHSFCYALCTLDVDVFEIEVPGVFSLRAPSKGRRLT